MPMKKHYVYLDIAKGIAIIAVVLGHCFPENLYGTAGLTQNTIAKAIYDFCYTWHMPVFFFISGYLFYNTWKSHNKTKLFEKAQRLLIPYLTFSILYIPLRLMMSNMANAEYSGYWKILIGISPNGGVWYLYVLFLFMVFSQLVLRNERLLLVATSIAGILNILSHSGLYIDYSVLRYTCIYYVFFGLGLIWDTEILNSIQLSFRRILVIIEIVVFIILFCLQEAFGFESLNILSGLIGINIVLMLSVLLEKNHRGEALQYAGTASMSIYLLHGPILVVVRTVLVKLGVQALLASLIMFIFGILLSVLIDKYIFHINCVTEFVFLGINRKNRTHKGQK